VLGLLSLCDAVLTVDNAVAHFASLLGVPTCVLVPAGQTQFRWKNPILKNLWFPKTKLCHQDVPGDWSTAVELGWREVMSLVKNGGEQQSC